MLGAIVICSLPLTAAVAIAAWKRWALKERPGESTSTIPQIQSVLPQLYSLAAIVISILTPDHCNHGKCQFVFDWEGAAAIAVLSGITGHIAKHAEIKAEKAIDAAIARIDQDSGGRRTVRTMTTNDERQRLKDLKRYLHNMAKGDDGNRCCKPGPGRGTLDLLAASYAAVSVLIAACLVVLPWTPVRVGLSESDPVLLRQVAAVLLVLATPKAFLISKRSPFWCSVAASARQGLLGKESRHIERYLLGQTDDAMDGSTTPDRLAGENLFYRQHIGRTCRKTTRQNLVISVVGSLATLCTLVAIAYKNHLDPPRIISSDGQDVWHWYKSPWYALLVELLVTSIIALNSTRCAHFLYQHYNVPVHAFIDLLLTSTGI